MVTFRRWEIVEQLDSEDEIRTFLESAMKDGGLGSLPRALAKAAKARSINQLAAETGVDRHTLCTMFLDSDDGEHEFSFDVIAQLVRAFGASVQG
jgi:probable addiction module antidote protein